jgi:hypothetical protein
MTTKELLAVLLAIGIIVGVGLLGHRMAEADDRNGAGPRSSTPSSFNARYFDD